MNYKVGEAGVLGVPADDVAAFYRMHWKRKIALGLPSFYRWQFIEPPENLQCDTTCVVVGDDLSLHGVMGVNKRSFWLGGELTKGAELTTWVIDGNLRGRGLGFKILEFLQANYDVLMGMGISGEAIPLYMSSGFQYMSSIPRFVRVFDVSVATHLTVVDKLGRRLIKRGARENDSKYEVHEIDLLRFDIDNIGGFRQKYNHYSRDAKTLDWRYTRHPLFSYKSHLVSSGNGLSLVILRVEEIEGIRFVHLMDCIGDSVSLPGTLKFLDDYCRGIGASFMDFYCTSSSISRYFRYFGWFSALDDYWVKVAHLFYPVEMRSPPTTSLVYWAKGDMLRLMELDRLYVSKQDLDLDRPTVDTYRKMGNVDEINSVAWC